jgi:outer membrane protein assembly factor BamB
VQRWQYHAQGSVSGAVVIVGDLVYASSDDDVLHALDLATGNERWTFSPPKPPVSGPTVVDGVVYAFDGAGTLFALDAATGLIRWHAPAPLDGPSSLTVGAGSLYVGTADGALVALDVTTGAERWRYPVSSTGGRVNNPAFADGIVYAGSDSDGFAAVDATTGALLWHFVTGPSSATAVVAEGIAYIGDHIDTGPVPGHRYALDARSGKLLWHLDQQRRSPAVSDGVAYFGSDSGLVMAHATATSTELWKFQVQGAAVGAAVAGDVFYVAADAEHRLYALDTASGKELWHFDLDGGISCCVAVADGAIFVGTDAGSVYRIDGDGTTISPGSSATAPPSPTAPPSTPPTASPVGFPPPVEFVWSATGDGEGMKFPGAMAIDPKGRLWVADTGNSRFAIFDPDSTFVEYWEHRGSGRGEFLLQQSNGDGCGAIAFAPDGSFYVLDCGNYRVEHFDKNRTFIKDWGSFGTVQASSSVRPGLRSTRRAWSTCSTVSAA